MTSQTDYTKYTREELIYLSRLYDKSENYPEMVNCICEFIRLNPRLDLSERNILSAGFKNIISNKRFSWRYLQNLINKDTNQTTIGYINEIKLRIEKEMREICKKITSLLDNLILPNENIIENRVHYLKMKADYYRYQCEFLKDEELSSVCDFAYKIYQEAYLLAEESLPISSTSRIGTALNYSVFLYEVQSNVEEACRIAKNAINEGIKILDDLERNKQKDTILIIQLLTENLMLWNSDDKDEEMGD